MNQILPLAITMMAGPQIITSILLVTAKRVIAPSLAYIAAVALAATTGTLVFFGIANLFGLQESGTNNPSTFALTIQTLLVVLLIFLSLKTFLNRRTSELPSWMRGLQNTTPKKAFKVGLTLIFLMPSDLIIMSTVGINLASQSSNSVALLPFIALTTLIAALPLLAYLLFGEKAKKTMPKARTWMEHNSWVVSIIAYAIFIYLLWP